MGCNNVAQSVGKTILDVFKHKKHSFVHSLLLFPVVADETFNFSNGI